MRGCVRSAGGGGSAQKPWITVTRPKQSSTTQSNDYNGSRRRLPPHYNTACCITAPPVFSGHTTTVVVSTTLLLLAPPVQYVLGIIGGILLQSSTAVAKEYTRTHISSSLQRSPGIYMIYRPLPQHGSAACSCGRCCHPSSFICFRSFSPLGKPQVVLHRSDNVTLG